MSTAAFSDRIRHPSANAVLREMVKGTPCIFDAHVGFFKRVRSHEERLIPPSWVLGWNPSGGRDLTYASRPPGGLPSLMHKIYRVFFPGVKRPWRGVNHPPHLAQRSHKEYSIPLLPLWAFMACHRAKFTFTFTFIMPRLLSAVWVRIPPNGFLRNSIFETFKNISQEKQNLIKIA